MYYTMEVKINSPFSLSAEAKAPKRNYNLEFLNLVEWALVHKPESVTVRRATEEDGSIVGNKTNLGKFAFIVSEQAFQKYYGAKENFPSVYFADYPRFFTIKTGTNSHIKSAEGSANSNNLERDFPQIYNYVCSNFRTMQSQTTSQLMTDVIKDQQHRNLHAKPKS